MVSKSQILFKFCLIQNLAQTCMLAASSMLGILAQRCTFTDDDAEEFVDDAVETEEDEAETAEQMKKRSMMMTRKGSWHSHISQRSREHELSIGGITV